MSNSADVPVCFGALAAGLILCATVWIALLRRVLSGKSGRFAATAVQGVAMIPLGLAPILLALAAKALGGLCGVKLFTGDGGNDGNLIGVGVLGFAMAFGAAVLFAAVMVIHALTGILGAAPPTASAAESRHRSRDRLPDTRPRTPSWSAGRRDTADR